MAPVNRRALGAGSVILARPFTRRRVTLVLAVPLAALGGLVAFGAVALLIAAVLAIPGDQATPSGGGSLLDWTGGGGGGGGGPRRRDRDDDER